MYLRRVRKTRKPITVCDRDDPVAQLVPLAEPAADGELSPSDRERLQAQLEKHGILVELPAASGSAWSAGCATIAASTKPSPRC